MERIIVVLLPVRKETWRVERERERESDTFSRRCSCYGYAITTLINSTLINATTMTIRVDYHDARAKDAKTRNLHGESEREREREFIRTAFIFIRSSLAFPVIPLCFWLLAGPGRFYFARGFFYRCFAPVSEHRSTIWPQSPFSATCGSCVVAGESWGFFAIYSAGLD